MWFFVQIGTHNKFMAAVSSGDLPSSCILLKYWLSESSLYRSYSIRRISFKMYSPLPGSKSKQLSLSWVESFVSVQKSLNIWRFFFQIQIGTHHNLCFLPEHSMSENQNCHDHCLLCLLPSILSEDADNGSCRFLLMAGTMESEYLPWYSNLKYPLWTYVTISKQRSMPLMFGFE